MHQCRTAFSLLELSIVLVIVSVVAVLGLEVANQFVARRAYVETQAKLARIDQAIVDFRRIHGRLPCIADTASNGMEYSSCTNTGLTSTVITGTVPYVALNLSFDDVVDSYGNLINYAVSRRLTLDATTSPANNFNDSTAMIEIRTGRLQNPCSTTCSVLADPTASPATGAAYAVFSNGYDRRGGRNRVGTVAVACFSAVGDTRIDSQNCWRTTGTSLTIFAALTAVQKEALFYDSRYNAGSQTTNYFDDIIVWRTKGRL